MINRTTPYILTAINPLLLASTDLHRDRTRNSSGDEIANVNFLRRHLQPLLRSAPLKLTQNKGHDAVQGHFRSQILVLIASSYTTSY